MVLFDSDIENYCYEKILLSCASSKFYLLFVNEVSEVFFEYNCEI